MLMQNLKPRGLDRPAAMVALLRKSSTAAIIKKTDTSFVPVYNKQKIAFERGQGCYLYDAEGRKFLDLAAGVAVNSLGHADPDWLRTMNEQAAKVVHVSNIFYNQPAADLAEVLCKNSFAKSVFFCNSGTEANEGALKFARKLTKSLNENKTEYVSFLGGFHGRSMGALSVTANPKYQDPFRPLIPGVKHLKLNDLPSLREAVTDQTSAVIVEPIQGEGGINAATREFLQELRDICTKKNAVLIFDEIQCGMGRTGKLWAHEHAGVVPDIMTVAKALGNGFPIGAILVNQKITDALKFGDHGSTFAGQPLACAIGMTVFSKINKPAFLNDVTEVGNYFKQQIKDLKSPLVREVRGEGLILGVDIDMAKAGVADLGPITQSFADKRVVLLTAGGSVLRIVPPLIITKKEVDAAIDVFKAVLAEFPKSSK